MTIGDKNHLKIYLPDGMAEDLLIICMAMEDDGHPGMTRTNGEYNRSAALQRLISEEKSRLKQETLDGRIEWDDMTKKAKLNGMIEVSS